MRRHLAAAFLIVACSSYVASFRTTTNTQIGNELHFASSNADMFGSDSSPRPAETAVGAVVEKPKIGVSSRAGKMAEEAARLRKEAAEMEVSLREEARSRGVPEELIDKLVPIRVPGKAPIKAVVQERPKLSREEIRTKLGYLTIGDAVRMSIDLDRVKGKNILELWNSQMVENTNYLTTANELSIKTSIDPIKLKLDDVGYNYQNLFIGALGVATVFGLGSSQIGGQLGFILGYLSALFPIALVGIGSIAPALINDLLLKFKLATDNEAKERFLKWNAGKFLVGYVLGLPISRFNSGGNCNTVEYFQIRPDTKQDKNNDNRQMFAKKVFKQDDIARSSVVCLAGAVAECIAFGEATGAVNVPDVNILYELISTVEPPLSSDRVQAHIRWAAVAAYDILTKYPKAYENAVEAFRQGLPLEECIAAIEETAYRQL